MRNHQKTFTMLLVLVLIGLNMRPLLTSVGPLLPQLRQASGMSFSVAALLTALPVVTMGGLALAGSWLHQHVRGSDGRRWAWCRHNALVSST